MQIRMDLQFDFRLHEDRSGLAGTQYFEFAPGRYRKPWAPGSRYIHEYTFSLVEGVLESRVPGYDHFAFVEVPRPMWLPILRDLAVLRAALDDSATGARVTLPYGFTLNVQAAFEEALETNQRALSALLVDLESWLHRTLADHDVVSVLGL
jgi:hypothetical protein